jgi:DNA replication protein DnaC
MADTTHRHPSSTFHPSDAARNTKGCEFDLCDGSGFLVDEDTRTSSPCRCRPRRVARSRSRLLEGQIPREFREVSFENSVVLDIERTLPSQVRTVRGFVRSLESNLEAGHGLWLMGGPGTGKTTMAMIVSRNAIAAGRSVAIYSCPRLLSVIRESIDGTGTLDFLDRLAQVDLLQIDDLGAERRTEWVVEQLYTIINARYEAKRSMLVTSNLDADALEEQLGERIVSRLEGMCGEPLPFYGTDHRRRRYTVEPASTPPN